MEKKKMKKVICIILGSIMLVLLLLVGWLYLAFCGNPITIFQCKKKVISYVDENYQDLKLVVDQVSYDFKLGQYVVTVKSETSKDTYFSVIYSPKGELVRDEYAEMVASGWNTYRRVNKEYEDWVEEAMHDKGMPGNCEIYYGELKWDARIGAEGESEEELEEKDHRLNSDRLELDKDYDVKELGKEYGHLNIYAEEKEVTAVNAAQMLLKIHKYLESKGITYYDVYFVLQYPKPDEDTPRPEGQVTIENFRASDIYEDGLVERITNWKCVRDNSQMKKDMQP